MNKQDLFNKPISKLTPEEREQIIPIIAKTIEDGLRQWGFPSFSSFVETLNTGVAALFEKFKIFLAEQKEAHKLLKIPIGMLAEHGWYPSWYMTHSDTINATILLKDGKIEELNKQMTKFFKEQENDIEEIICSRFPNRATLIKAAFRAHRHGDYELSIPLMLAQADGICQEIIQINLYSKKSGVPMTSEFAERFASDVFLSALLEPLCRVGVISANTKDLINTSGILNRHGILHGSITDYATQDNSYKVLSLLSYVSDFIPDAAKRKTA